MYERRKNYYKNAEAPIRQVVSIGYVAQAVMAIALQEPDIARARPSSLLKKDADYRRLFNAKHPVHMYFVCPNLLRRTEEFLRDAIAKSVRFRNELKDRQSKHLPLRRGAAAPPSA